MSALDDLIARDASLPAQGGVDALIARDASMGPAAQPAQVPTPAATQSPAAQASQPGMLASVGAGLGHGFGSTVLAGQQLLGRGAQAIGASGIGDWLVNDADKGIGNLNAQYSPYQQAHPIAAGAGNIGGQVAATAPMAAALPAAATTSLAGRALSGAALGAGSGALTPVENMQPGQSFGAEKLKQIATGAALGAAAAPVTGVVGDAIAGAGGAAQRRLAQAGVTMTPGQILGGALARTEDKMTSLPVLGDLIKNAQQRSVQSFNRAAYNEVLAPLGQTYQGPTGNEGVQAVQRTIGDAYDNALSRMTFRATDPQFQADIQNLSGMAQSLPPSQQQTFMNVLNTQIMGKVSPQGVMDGQTLKGVQSELSRLARGYSGDASFDNRQLGAAVGEIKNAIDSSLPRYNAPDAVQGLANANAAWANFVRLRTAAASQGAMNNGGVFTGAQLSAAVRNADKSAGKGASATGNALMQDFSTAGQQVLGSKYPDSGTAGRSMLGLAAGALAGHELLPASVMAPAAIGIGAASLPYTAYGQRLAQALLMSRPAGAKAVGSAVNRFLAPVSALGVPALANGP